MGNKLLLFAFLLVFLPILVSAEICEISENCGSNFYPLFSVYDYYNSHVSRNTNLDLKVCCPGGPFSPSDSCSGEEVVFYTYTDENTHISGIDDRYDPFCFFEGDENSGISCEFKEECSDEELCVVSTYSNDNTHVGDCYSDLGYKICCSGVGDIGPLCGNNIIEDGEECDGHFNCYEEGHINECFCWSDDDKTRSLMNDTNQYNETHSNISGTLFVYNNTGATNQRSQGCCVDDDEVWICKIHPVHGFQCLCEDTAVCGNEILEPDEECEILDGEWGLGCIENFCTCDASANFVVNPNGATYDCVCMEGYAWNGSHCTPYPIFNPNQICTTTDSFEINITYSHEGVGEASYCFTNQGNCDPNTKLYLGTIFELNMEDYGTYTLCVNAVYNSETLETVCNSNYEYAEVCGPLNGLCGSANTTHEWTGNNNTFSGNELCSQGDANETPITLLAESGETISWQCLGINGGDYVTCQAERLHPNECDEETLTWSNCAANSIFSSHDETIELTNTNEGYTGNANYTCNNGNWEGPTDEICLPIINAVCGSAATEYDWTGSSTTINSNMCSVGNADPSEVTLGAEGGETISWQCLGENGGNNVTCQAERLHPNGCGPESNIPWWEGQCFGDISEGNHEDIILVNNDNPEHYGYANFTCNNGEWNLIGGQELCYEPEWQFGNWECIGSCERNRTLECENQSNDIINDYICQQVLGDESSHEIISNGYICNNGEEEEPSSSLNTGTRYTSVERACTYDVHYMGCYEGGHSTNCNYATTDTANVSSGYTTIQQNCGSFPERGVNCENNYYCDITQNQNQCDLDGAINYTNILFACDGNNQCIQQVECTYDCFDNFCQEGVHGIPEGSAYFLGPIGFDGEHEPTEWTYEDKNQEDLSACEFTCANDYVWNGTDCIELTYSWVFDSWTCQSDCVRQRNVYCENSLGETVGDENCEPSSKPNETESVPEGFVCHTNLNVPVTCGSGYTCNPGDLTFQCEEGDFFVSYSLTACDGADSCSNIIPCEEDCSEPCEPTEHFEKTDCELDAYICGLSDYPFEYNPTQWTYDEDLLACQYTCAEGYYWNGTECNLIVSYVNVTSNLENVPVDISGHGEEITNFTIELIPGETTFISPESHEGIDFAYWYDGTNAYSTTEITLNLEPFQHYNLELNFSNEPIYIITVQSQLGNEIQHGVEIEGSYPGTTTYSFPANNGEEINLIAPFQHEHESIIYNYSSWSNCDNEESLYTTNCYLNVFEDRTLTVNYVEDEIPPPPISKYYLHVLSYVGGEEKGGVLIDTVPDKFSNYTQYKKPIELGDYIILTAPENHPYQNAEYSHWDHCLNDNSIETRQCEINVSVLKNYTIKVYYYTEDLPTQFLIVKSTKNHIPSQGAFINATPEDKSGITTYHRPIQSGDNIILNASQYHDDYEFGYWNNCNQSFSNTYSRECIVNVTDTNNIYVTANYFNLTDEERLLLIQSAYNDEMFEGLIIDSENDSNAGTTTYSIIIDNIEQTLNFEAPQIYQSINFVRWLFYQNNELNQTTTLRNYDINFNPQHKNQLVAFYGTDPKCQNKPNGNHEAYIFSQEDYFDENYYFNDSYVNKTWTYSSNSELDDCEFTCAEGYYYEEGICKEIYIEFNPNNIICTEDQIEVNINFAGAPINKQYCWTNDNECSPNIEFESNPVIQNSEGTWKLCASADYDSGTFTNCSEEYFFTEECEWCDVAISGISNVNLDDINEYKSSFSWLHNDTGIQMNFSAEFEENNLFDLSDYSTDKEGTKELNESINFNQPGTYILYAHGKINEESKCSDTKIIEVIPSENCTISIIPKNSNSIIGDNKSFTINYSSRYNGNLNLNVEYSYGESEPFYLSDDTCNENECEHITPELVFNYSEVYNIVAKGDINGMTCETDASVIVDGINCTGTYPDNTILGPSKYPNVFYEPKNWTYTDNELNACKFTCKVGYGWNESECIDLGYPKWNATEWVCDGQCMQTREVDCINITIDGTVIIHDEHCEHLTKPSTSQNVPAGEICEGERNIRYSSSSGQCTYTKWELGCDGEGQLSTSCSSTYGTFTSQNISLGNITTSATCSDSIPTAYPSSSNNVGTMFEGLENSCSYSTIYLGCNGEGDFSTSCDGTYNLKNVSEGKVVLSNFACQYENPENLPNKDNFCGDDLYYGYVQSACNYNEYYRGCTGLGSCGDINHAQNETQFVGNGQIIISETNLWTNITPEIGDPTEEISLQTRYVSDYNSCTYQMWHVGCFDEEEDLCNEVYSEMEIVNVTEGQIALEHNCDIDLQLVSPNDIINQGVRYVTSGPKSCSYETWFMGCDGEGNGALECDPIYSLLTPTDVAPGNVVLNKSCETAYPEILPNKTHFCSDNLRYIYTFNQCSYTEYYRGCDGNNQCGDINFAQNDLLFVERGLILNETNTWTTINPLSEFIVEPYSENYRDVKYVGEHGSCLYQAWYLGCDGSGNDATQCIVEDGSNYAYPIDSYKVAYEAECVNEIPLTDPNISIYCGGSLYYGYVQGACNYNEYYRGCDGDSNCGDITYTQEDLFYVGDGNIINSTNPWTNVSPQLNAIQESSEEHNLGTRYVSENNECSYEKWFIGCHPSNQIICSETYSTQTNQYVGENNVSISANCVINKPEIELSCDNDWTINDTEDYCLNFNLSFNRAGCDGSGNQNTDYITCLKEACSIGGCGSPFNPGREYYSNGILDYSFNLNFDFNGDGIVTCNDFNNYFGNYRDNEELYYGGLTGDPDTCEIIIDYCVEDLCYHEHYEDKCNYLYDEDKISYINDPHCILEIDGLKTLACCTSEACGLQRYKYVPINVLFDGENYFNGIDNIYRDIDWNNCYDSSDLNKCNIILEEEGGNINEFLSDMNCFDRERKISCCTHASCAVNRFSYVPITEEFVWAIDVILPDGLERFTGEGTPWNLPTLDYHLNTSGPKSGPGWNTYYVEPSNVKADLGDIIKLIVYGGSGNNIWEVSNGCSIEKITKNSFSAYVKLKSKECVVSAFDNENVFSAYVHIISNQGHEQQDDVEDSS